jgi:hypothetical protein
VNVVKDDRGHRSSTPVGYASAEQFKGAIRRNPTNYGDGDERDVVAGRRSRPQEGSTHDLNAVVERIEVGKHKAHRTPHVIDRPEKGGDKHSNLRKIHHHLLHVAEAQAQEAQEQADPNAIDDEEEETGNQKKDSWSDKVRRESKHY